MITAIVCEYNPFHKGHKYQIDTVRRIFPQAKIVSVMSPNFVQRGRPAIFDKYVRGECAVRCGVDLAVSMPQVFALLSAEGFAEGGVRLAHMLGADSIAFGVEDNDLSSLADVAELLISSTFESRMKGELALDPSVSYPVTRQKVVAEFLGEKKASLISSPNNILAVEYIKAIMRYCPDMRYIAVKREGNGYSDTSENGSMLSATAIRRIMEEGREWRDLLPEEVLSTLDGALMTDSTRYDDLLFSVLSVGQHADILRSVGNKELADTVASSVKDSGDYAHFRKALSRRKFPETRIDRALVNYLLGIENDSFMHCLPEYATLLAMNAQGREIIRKSTVEVLSKFGDAKRLEGAQIEKELLADRIWARCCETPSGERYFVNKKPYITEEIK